MFSNSGLIFVGCSSARQLSPFVLFFSFSCRDVTPVVGHRKFDRLLPRTLAWVDIARAKAPPNMARFVSLTIQFVTSSSFISPQWNLERQLLGCWIAVYVITQSLDTHVIVRRDVEYSSLVLHFHPAWCNWGSSSDSTILFHFRRTYYNLLPHLFPYLSAFLSIASPRKLLTHTSLPPSLLQVYATSEPFEIKALGSAYPSQSTPTAATNSTSSSPDSASASKPISGALDMGASFGGIFAGALAAAAAVLA